MLKKALANFYNTNVPPRSFFFFFNDTATTEIYTLSLHAALPLPNLTRTSMKRRVLATLGGVLLLSGALTVYARAHEPATTNPEIERLKTQLAAQQKQIDQLRRVLEEQKKVLDQASQPKPPSLGQVASTTAIIPAGDVAPVLHPGLAAAVALPQSDNEPASPLQLKIGT